MQYSYFVLIMVMCVTSTYVAMAYPRRPSGDMVHALSHQSLAGEKQCCQANGR